MFQGDIILISKRMVVVQLIKITEGFSFLYVQ